MTFISRPSAIQLCPFPNGGFALHKIQGDFAGHVSAWYDKEGALLDAEQFFPSRAHRSVAKHGAIWNHAQTVGLRFVPSKVAA